MTKRRLWGRLVDDARQLARAAAPRSELALERPPAEIAQAVLSNDSYRILTLTRIRESSRGRLPGVNHLLRMATTGVFGVEIGNDVTLGVGVYFVHPIGITIGGDAVIGDRVRFYGNNTVGSADDDGYPTIEDDVVVGAGARIIGPIRVGARSKIGANAVVTTDVPPDSVAVGIPARVVKSSSPPS